MSKENVRQALELLIAHKEALEQKLEAVVSHPDVNVPMVAGCMTDVYDYSALTSAMILLQNYYKNINSNPNTHLFVVKS